MTTPSDLVPLPFFPWDTRPFSLALTDDEACTALYLEGGHQHRAAARLKVDPKRLRRHIRSSPRALALLDEFACKAVDDAEHILREAVQDSDRRRADSAARFLLTHHREGLARGYSSAPSPSDEPSSLTHLHQHLTVLWADGTKIAELGRAEPDGEDRGGD